MPTPGATVTHTSRANGVTDDDWVIDLVPPMTSIPEGAVLVVIVRHTSTIGLPNVSGWSGSGYSRGRIYRRIAGASEPVTLTVPWDFDTAFAATAYMIPEGDATVSPVVANGEDPPELATGWDAEDVGEIVYIAAWASNRAAHTLDSPSGYGNQTQARSTSSSTANNECQLNTATRVATNLTEDPGAWDVTAGPGANVAAAATIAVRIPPGDGPEDHVAEGSMSAPAPRASIAASLELPEHSAGGSLSAPAARLSGELTHGDIHTATGGVTAPSPLLSGAASLELPEHTAGGGLTAPAPRVSGELLHSDGHQVEGGLSAPPPGLSGSASMELPPPDEEAPLAAFVGGVWIPLRVGADAGWTETRRTPGEDSRRGYGREAYPRSGRRAPERDVPFSSAELERAEAIVLRQQLSARPLILTGYLTRGLATGVARTVRLANTPGSHLYVRVEGEIALDPPPQEIES